MRSTNGSCGAGAASCTAAITLSKACGPVIARDVRECVADRLGLRAHAAGDDDAAVLVHRRADRGERFGLGAVEEAAGVDDDGVGAGVAARELVALGAELGQDPLAVDQRLRAAERNEGNARRGRALRVEKCRSWRPIATSSAGRQAITSTAGRRRLRSRPSGVFEQWNVYDHCTWLQRTSNSSRRRYRPLGDEAALHVVRRSPCRNDRGVSSRTRRQATRRRPRCNSPWRGLVPANRPA